MLLQSVTFIEGGMYNGSFLYYILTLYFKTTVRKVLICNILSFLLHVYFGMVWIAVRQVFFTKMETKL